MWLTLNLLMVCITTWGVLRGYDIVRHTSLTAAWRWCVTAVIVHDTAILLPLLTPWADTRSLTALHFLAATLMLAAPVSVLGARRPGAEAWPWFVVLPMLLVLNWPIVNELIWTDAARAIEVGFPAVAGVLLVTVMAAGNYLGTRNWFPAVLFAASVVGHLSLAFGWITDVRLSPGAASVPACVAVVISLWLAGNRTAGEAADTLETANRLWLRFRDLYGIVWAARVADRASQFARREHWQIQPGIHGFSRTTLTGSPAESVVDAQPSTAESAAGQTDAMNRPLAVLCWLLRRFVDDAWLESALNRHYQPELHSGPPGVVGGGTTATPGTRSGDAAGAPASRPQNR